MNPFVVSAGSGLKYSLRRNTLCRDSIVRSISLWSKNPSTPRLPRSDAARCPVHRSYHTTVGTLSEAAPADPVKASDDEMPPILWTTHRLNAASIQKVEKIFHKILWLDMFESCMLNDIINRQMGITLTPRQRKQLAQLMEDRAEAAMGRSPAGAAEEAPPEEAGPVLVDLQLAKFEAAAKIKVIKEVRSILGLGLKEAKELVESAPVTLQKGLKPDAAEEMKTKLEAAGATIALL
jgi:large subunit ribosomal protein L7/L12